MSAHFPCSQSSEPWVVWGQTPAPPGDIWPHVSYLLAYMPLCKASQVERETTEPLLEGLRLWSFTQKKIFCVTTYPPLEYKFRSQEQTPSPICWLTQKHYSSAKITAGKGSSTKYHSPSLYSGHPTHMLHYCNEKFILQCEEDNPIKSAGKYCVLDWHEPSDRSLEFRQ